MIEGINFASFMTTPCLASFFDAMPSVKKRAWLTQTIIKSWVGIFPAECTEELENYIKEIRLSCMLRIEQLKFRISYQKIKKNEFYKTRIA